MSHSRSSSSVLLILGALSLGASAGAAPGPLTGPGHAPSATAPGLAVRSDRSASNAVPAASPAAAAATDSTLVAAAVPGAPSASGAGDPASLGMEITEFRQREPGDGEPASEPTRAYVSYDENNLYVVFVCQDEPGQVRANVVPRERITDDDRVALYIDTFDDNQRAYAFEVNPHGIQRDGILTEGQDDDYTFDALWYSEGRMTETGYVVRMRIPFGSLRFAEKPAQTWGIGLARYIERKNEKSYWPYVTDRIEGFVNQLGTLQGLANISPGRRYQAVPYGVVAAARYLDDEGDVADFRRAREQRAGVDLKAVIHDATTLDVAVNPDFSQVEPDEPQVTVNQRFEKKVEEKRPFFLESAGYFVTPIELFFSRRIADPTGGARITSKLGAWAVGALAMDDRQPGHVPGDDPYHGRQAYVGVARAQREFRNQSTLGLFISDRYLEGPYDRTLAADARIKLGKNWVLTGQAVRTDTRDIENVTSSGYGGYFKVRRSGRQFDVSATYHELSPEFSAPLGFVERVGFREVKNDWEYSFRPKKAFVQAWGPKIGGTFNWDWLGRLQDAEVEAVGNLELAADTQLEVGWAEIFELFEEKEFRLRRFSALAESEWLRWLAISAAYERGTDVNHDPPRRVQPFRADVQEMDLGVAVRPFSWLEYKQSFTHSWMRVVADASRSDVWYRRVYTNWIVKSKLKLQVNRELSLRAIANYEALIPDPKLSDEDEERELVPDLLITYLVNPWTALHAGYTERYENVLLVDGDVEQDAPSTRGFHMPSTSVDRQLFLKVSYLFRM